MTGVTTRIDVRSIPVWLRHPKIFAAFDKLAIDGRLEITSDHEPRPLRYEFDLERPGAFLWDQQMLDEGLWLAVIRRVPQRATAPDHRDFLRRSLLLADVDEESCTRITGAATERTVGLGDVVIEQGEAFPYLGLVQTGVVAAIALSKAGREQMIYEALPFETFGETEALDGGAATTRFAAIHSAGRIVLIPRQAIVEACRTSPGLARFLGVAVARRMRMLVDWAGALAFSSITARVARALLPYAAAAEGLAAALPPLGRMSQPEIATTAGTVRVVAARALAELAAAGAIELQRGRVVKIDRARLTEFGQG